jgi:hypothetical protein
MNSKRNIILIAIIALTAGLLATTWRVMADIDPVPVLVPGGIYTGVMPTPPEFTFTTTVVPMDPAGNTMAFIMRNDNHDPTLLDPNPPLSEADHLTDFVGNMVRTGSNTWDYTGVAYGTKKVEGQGRPEILYVAVVQGTTTCTEDGNALTSEGTFALYLPEQDANGDGFPDADQEPAYCGPPAAFTIVRMPVTPPCVPTPVPEDQ